MQHLIYGRGLGPQEHSIQIPALIRQARRSGLPRHVGPGLNIWSTVHIEDVADLHRLVLERAAPGTFMFVMFVENGEASFGDMVGAIGRALGLGDAQAWRFEDAVSEWGFQRAAYSLGSNSRVRARRARALGWSPKHASLLDWVARELPRLRRSQ